MAKTFVVTLPDKLVQALMVEAEQRQLPPEETMLKVLSEQLIDPSRCETTQPAEADSLLQLIGSISVDIPDLAENHDSYIGQGLYRELKGVE